MFQFIVFDLDGTLVNSQIDLANATNALIEDLGGTRLRDEAIAAMVGEGATVLVGRALTAASLDPGTPGALERFLRNYDERLLEHTVPYEGMIPALEGIRALGVSMAVLTNKPARATGRLLDGLGLRHYFRDVVGGDTSFGRKPDPAGLLRLIARADATPSSTLLVGDSAIDLATARRAGSGICLARYGFGYRFADADFRGDELFIDEPLELLGRLACP